MAELNQLVTQTQWWAGGSEILIEEEIRASEEEQAKKCLIWQIEVGDLTDGETEQQVDGTEEYFEGVKSNFMAQMSLKEWWKGHWLGASDRLATSGCCSHTNWTQ